MNDLEQSVDRVAAETGFSGVVRVDRGDGVELAKAYGLARRGHQVAATVDTQFVIASGGKGLTALAVVSLIEASELDLATTDRSVLGNDLPLIGAGQGQSTTARWTPLLSLAVPCSMPQTCPKAPLGYEPFERHSYRCSPVEISPPTAALVASSRTTVPPCS
jgi:Beta-lactamase